MKRQAPGRAYVGLALLGWGSSILLGVTPHEDVVVGVGLAAFGLALCLSARSLPTLPLSKVAVAAAGAGVAICVLVFDAFLHASLDVPTVSLLVFGAALVACSPLLARSIPLTRTRRLEVATVVTCTVPVLGAPLAA